jgi:hypothetical protein
MCIRVRIGVLVTIFGATATLATHAQHYANVRTFLEDSPEFRTANPIVQRLTEFNGVPRFNWAIIESGAEAEHMGRPVWILASVVRALKAEPGQLAFVIAHGIAKIDVPTKIENRNLVCTDKPAQTMAALGNPRDYLVKNRAECESMADPIAVRYIASAGYNPLDASAFVARVFNARLNEGGHQLLFQAPWVRDYADMFAVDGQRLNRLRLFVNEFCRENTSRC